MLTPTGFGDGQHALDKQPPVLGLRPMRGAPPDNWVAERALGGVIGGFDAGSGDE